MAQVGSLMLMLMKVKSMENEKLTKDSRYFLSVSPSYLKAPLVLMLKLAKT